MYNQTFCCPLHYKNGLFVPLGLLAILYQVTTTVPHFVSMCFLPCRLRHPVRGYSSSWRSVTSPCSDLVSRISPSHLSNVLSLSPSPESSPLKPEQASSCLWSSTLHHVTPHRSASWDQAVSTPLPSAGLLHLSSYPNLICLEHVWFLNAGEFLAWRLA